ncbi:hypothetical protein CsSME_00018207 [Camellia sinensis var. sinensis]
MESNGGDASTILRELENLKSSKIEIERRISFMYSGVGLGLSPEMIYRYSRHLLLPSVGVQGQSNLLKTSILVVGAGGLGSPALLYLAACGVGRLGIVDHDIVELNDLHRQIIRTEVYIGQSKVESAAAACRLINSTIQIVEHKEALRTSNALEILSKYDIAIDATDNAPRRYLISDFYNYDGGLCYRCLFPTPPPATTCQRCSDSGVLGVVPGIIGCFQALEARKIASAIGEPLSGRMLLMHCLPRFVLYVKIRGRSLQCEFCGVNTAFTQQKFQKFDYEKFTQSPFFMSPLKLNLLPTEARISSKEFNERVVKGEAHVLLDVRPAHHFKIVSLPKSVNIPLSSLAARLPEISSALKQEEPMEAILRGNDSQRAIEYLRKMGFASAKDIVGGLESWARDVDPNFTTY